MRKGILAIIAISLAGLMMGEALACDARGHSGIVEENNLWIPVGAKTDSEMTEEKFNTILDDIKEIYAPIIEDEGKQLKIERKWDDGTVNAYAQQVGNTWKISMFGGLARHDTITPDGFAMVACHELGHHLGGLPKKSSWWGGTSWASNEGQSDYFGTMKCFRKYIEDHDNQSIVNQLDVPEYASEKCRESFSNPKAVAMCERAAMGGRSLGNLFRALRDMDTPIKFNTPSDKVVDSTDHSHPAPQCRLDTYFQASLCTVDHYTDMSDSDPTQGVCARKLEFENGFRPRCWYKPADE